jgi:hypothetical protein
LISLMLVKLDALAGAFERDDGAFELWSLRLPQYQDARRPTRAPGA